LATQNADSTIRATNSGATVGTNSGATLRSSTSRVDQPIVSMSGPK
jgi:hypothetical protein